MELPKSGMIVHDQNRCYGCGVCQLMCSLYHEGVQGISLSRVDLVRNPFSGDFVFNKCEQCYSPACYYACPVEAVKIDSTTGARYINEDECIGCGKCVEACPFMSSSVHKTIGSKTVNGKKVYFKCDLCKDRDEGPICVEYCPAECLTFVTESKR
jgi:Fe-S-cluster-containing hydrogenase component 2